LLAPILLRDGVIASTRAFVLAAKASASTTTRLLEPGYFKLRKGMNAALAYKLLINPANQVQTKITIPEGYRISQVLGTLVHDDSRISLRAYQAALKDPAALGLPAYANGNPEGYLFPSTYQIPPHTSAAAVLKGMVTLFINEAATLSLPAAAQRGQVSESHVIIVASLVQAEGGRPSDYPKIAEVIYNRLNSGMKLQLDSTVMFALGKYAIQATDQELQTNSPYNTYLHTGLPPGPIDNPGDAAIRAALHPAHGRYVYFVTVDPLHKITKFTASSAQFQQFETELANNIKNHT
jgi:UPF0755 protein